MYCINRGVNRQLSKKASAENLILEAPEAAELKINGYT
jgi:hypothetical protein